MIDDDEDDDDFSVDSEDPSPRSADEPGPPDDWRMPSYFHAGLVTWYWNGREDPCPATPLGFCAGTHFFVTPSGERRTFSARDLHTRAGLSDLFSGSMHWAERHYRKWDPEKGDWTGGLRRDRLGDALIRACRLKGHYDGSTPHRSVGTWRGSNGEPIVHAGDRIFHNGEIHAPGTMIDDRIFIVGSSRQAPSYLPDGRHGYSWKPASLADCLRVCGHLDEWHWADDESRDLFLGGLFCDMLGEAPLWRPHKFVRAPAGSGKSTLLKYTRALLGGAAHPIQRSYSKAFLEQMFSGTSSALLLDEMESDSDSARVRHLLELIRLLSDEGATGGRGTSGGVARTFDLHGAVTMVATLTEAWRPQDRSRITVLQLKRLADRTNHPPASPEMLAVITETAAELSPFLRARAIARFGLFQQNLALVRRRILDLGGSTRDGDQLGHLLAGWATMTSDAPIDGDTLGSLDRFKPYVLTLSDAEDQADDPSELFNLLLGLPTQVYQGGKQPTVGQMIARARDSDSGGEFRHALLALGLRLQRHGDESWNEAWLAVANKHPGLDKLFADYPEYRGPKRAQILGELRRVVEGVVWEVKSSEIPMRFAGAQSRALLIPPALLPSLEDEAQ
jgi:hypothetical protein